MLLYKILYNICKRFDCLSRRLPVTSGSNDDSDNSTDSDEDLDSPKRIVQQPTPAEKMDIDSNEGKHITGYLS